MKAAESIISPFASAICFSIFANSNSFNFSLISGSSARICDLEADPMNDFLETEGSRSFSVEEVPSRVVSPGDTSNRSLERHFEH